MKRKIILNEFGLYWVIKECARKILSEGVFPSRNKVSHYLNESIILLNESAQDKRVQNYLKGQGFTDYNKRMQIIGGLKHDIPNIRLDNNKFLLGCCRVFCERELTDEQSIRSLDNALKFIHAGGHIDEFDENLNGKSVNELHEMFRAARSNFVQNDRERSEKRTFNGRSDYEIIPINSYEEASRYGKYTSWCVTHDEDAFKAYTIYGNRFYFCLKNGFENITKDDTNAPLNEWGLSMIAVNVDQNGDLTRVTTRYNHDFNGENNPNLETTEQLENVLHVPFYQTFKPYTKAELLNKGVVPFDMVQQALDNGKTPQELFDEIYKVGDGINVVLYNDKYNFINSERKLLSPNLWFDNYGIFQNDFAPVQINEKWNYLTTKGKILSPNLWFDDIFPFTNYKLAKVFLDGKYNLINSEGNLLSPNRWLDDISFPYYGFYVVQLDYYENWCGPNGILTSNQWYDKCYHFNKSGFALFKLDNKYNVINKDGKIMFPNIWFDDHFVPPNIGEIGLTKDGEVYIFTMGGKLERGDITQL